jgi:hypothetical protein
MTILLDGQHAELTWSIGDDEISVTVGDEALGLTSYV